ncbi:unnamed protein product [Peniophora sp. CBMAI 1063]|nr:unnamed protein product [Peniophora sp. CBMAI 1063]
MPTLRSSGTLVARCQVVDDRNSLGQCSRTVAARALEAEALASQTFISSSRAVFPLRRSSSPSQGVVSPIYPYLPYIILPRFSTLASSTRQHSSCYRKLNLSQAQIQARRIAQSPLY